MISGFSGSVGAFAGSAGALAGALWAAGWTASEILEALTESTPLSQVAMHWPPWEGLFDLGPVRSLLSTQLPRRFSDLPIPLGVGVADLNRSPHLLTDGPLESAVAASCAVPWLFAPVEVQGVLWIDGGVADRTALRAWRAHRPNTQVVLHRVERTAGADHDEDLTAVRVVSSPRSGARLWNLGDVRARYERTRTTALRVLSDVDA